MPVASRLLSGLWNYGYKQAPTKAGNKLRLNRLFANTSGDAAAEAASADPGAGALGMPKLPNRVESKAKWLLRRVMLVTGLTAGVMIMFEPYEEDVSLFSNMSHPKIAALFGEVNEESFLNWSGTHSVTPRRLFQPNTEYELENIVLTANTGGQKLRVFGSGLSPNGMGFSDKAMVNMSNLDRVVSFNEKAKQVTVQAGMRIKQLTEFLKKHGLQLQNYAAINQQQVGGILQVGAHGSGARIPPIDEHLVSMKLVSPSLGSIEIDRVEDQDLIQVAQVGLGAVGIVEEATLQCVPREQIVDHTFTASMKDVKANHAKWLQDNKFLRYWWIPYTETVVVFAANPVKKNDEEQQQLMGKTVRVPRDKRLAPMKELWASKTGRPESEVADLDLTALRDVLYALAPLDAKWVAQVNQAEAKYWQMSEGVKVGWADEMLNYDCGGQQWVYEVAQPVGKLQDMGKPGMFGGVSFTDLQFIEELMAEIKRNKIPAHTPIEHRWTSASSAVMSPAHSLDPQDVFSWIGIIMYMDPEKEESREKVTRAFKSYAELVQNKLCPKYNAFPHWAKLELPDTRVELEKLRARLATRYPVDEFNKWRERLDPNNILANDWIDALFPRPDADPKQQPPHIPQQ